MKKLSENHRGIFWLTLYKRLCAIAPRMHQVHTSYLYAETGKQTYMKTEICTLCFRVFWIFLPNIVNILVPKNWKKGNGKRETEKNRKRKKPKPNLSRKSGNGKGKTTSDWIQCNINSIIEWEVTYEQVTSNRIQRCCTTKVWVPTETAVLRVLSDILQAVDRGDLAALILLDLTAAFDTVDHDILLQRLKVSIGFTDVALRWLQSDGHSTHDVETPSQPSLRLCVEFCRGQSWAPYCSLLHCRLDRSDWKPRLVTTHVCRRYAGVWLLWSCCSWRPLVDLRVCRRPAAS